MRFEDIYGRWQGRRLSQAQATEILGMSERTCHVPPRRLAMFRKGLSLKGHGPDGGGKFGPIEGVAVALNLHDALVPPTLEIIHPVCRLPSNPPVKAALR